MRRGGEGETTLYQEPHPVTGIPIRNSESSLGVGVGVLPGSMQVIIGKIIESDEGFVLHGLTFGLLK